MKNMRKFEQGQNSQLSTTLRIHIFALILHAAVTNPTKSPFLYPTIANGVYLSKYVCKKVCLSQRCWITSVQASLCNQMIPHCWELQKCSSISAFVTTLPLGMSSIAMYQLVRISLLPQDWLL